MACDWMGMGSNNKRDQIMAAGARVFARLGYHSATVEDVIREAGVARATFYSNFSDKRDLFTAVATGITDDIVNRVVQGIDAIAGPDGTTEKRRLRVPEFEERLSELIDGIARYVRRNRGIARVFLHEMVGVDREMTRLFYEFQERLIDQFERLVDYGVHVGMFRETERRTAAEFIVSGHMYLARSFSAGVGSYDVEEMAHRFMDLQLKGLLVKTGVAPAGRERVKARG